MNLKGENTHINTQYSSHWLYNRINNFENAQIKLRTLFFSRSQAGEGERGKDMQQTQRQEARCRKWVQGELEPLRHGYS